MKMSEDQQKQSKIKLLKDFYEISSPESNLSNPHTFYQHGENSSSKIQESVEISPERQAYLIDSSGFNSDRNHSSENKLLHTCSTQIVQSRRQNEEDDKLRQIQEIKESDEGSEEPKCGRRPYNENIELEQYEFQQKCSSPWAVCQQMSSIKWADNFEKSEKKTKSKSSSLNQKKRKSCLTKKHKQQLTVRLDYGKGRSYYVGMKDLNKKWFQALNSIHK